MKSHFDSLRFGRLLPCALALLCCLVASAPAQPVAGQYTIIDRGPNSRTWAATVEETTPFRDTITRTNLVYELASGRHYPGPGGEWLESQEVFTVLPDASGAVANQGPYQVFAPADIYQGVITITLPSGEVMHTRPVAVSYFDKQAAYRAAAADMEGYRGGKHLISRITNDSIGFTKVVWSESYHAKGMLLYAGDSRSYAPTHA